jgi:hypothetical protein
MTLSPEEFMRRFLLHVLPSGFHRIRHYGLLANGTRQHHIDTARQLLQQPRNEVAPEPTRAQASSAAAPTFVCRHCGAPMIIIETLAPAHAIRAPPSASPPA